MPKILSAALLTAVLSILLGAPVSGQSLQGTITDSQGNPLPFATVYFPDQKSGTASNEDGFYSIKLRPGSYYVVFQYLGFSTHEETVRIGNSDVNLDVTLKDEPVQLGEVTVTSDREDPAYTIMRKAIAKAKYHSQQVDSFSSTVYIKGSGRLKSLPGLFRKQIEKALEEEGIDTATAFTSESVSEVSYKRPNQYNERVISVRTVGDDNNTSPVGFVQSSFYDPEVNGSVSPLSPRAFAYYKFEFLGEFTDRGHLVNKIRVTPRSRGDNVFEGTLYIVDQLWSIHSLDLDTYIWGILFEIKQVYAPVEENVWLPVNHIFDVSGKFFGFKFEYVYFANVSDYEVFLNPELPEYVDVIDEKIEPELAQQAEENLNEETPDASMEKLASGEEISRKELRKMLREYEKEERKEFQQDTLEDVVEVRNFKVDTLAYTRDSIYWEQIRPIPLTKYEVRGYRVQDSISRANAAAEEAEADSVVLTVGSENSLRAPRKSAFEPMDILLGGDYKISDKGLRFAQGPIVGNFNTVDGIHIGTSLELYNNSQNVNWSLRPFVRYAFSRRRVNYNLRGSLSGGRRFQKWALVAEGGSMPFQLNRDEPIDPFVNGFMSYLFEQNFMKIYEKDYVYLGFQKDFSPKVRLEIEGEWSRNNQLNNTSTFRIFNSKTRDYTSNVPYNAEIGDTGFPQYQATTLSAGIRLRPWSRFIIRNGKKRIKDETTPTFSINIKTALPDLLGSDVEYTLLEAGFEHVIEFPAGGVLNLNIMGGGFINNNTMYFPEFRHFMGSQVPFATTDPVKAYRALDYYAYSTQEYFLTAHAFYQFRKLLATQIFEVRLAGIREGMFFSTLITPESQNYFELGYGLNYIFRIFRVEVATAWQDFEYQNVVVRVGIAANFETLFR